MPSEYNGTLNNTHPTWYKDPALRKNMGCVVLCYLAIYSLGYDGSLLNGLQALQSFDKSFGTPRGYTLGLIAASYYLPKIPAPPIVAWINDRYGRKKCLLIGAIIMVAGSLLGGLCNSLPELIGSRLLLGVGTVTSQLSAATLIPEFAHPRLRPYASSFLQTMFYIGSIFASWLTFAMVFFPDTSSAWSWRIPSLMQGFGPLLLLSAVFVPESPRWLIKVGREKDAHRILANHHANGKMDDELVLLEIREIKTALELEANLKTTSWSSFVSVPANRRRAFIIISLAMAGQLAGNGVVQYFLVPILRQVGITSQVQLAGINGGLAIFNWFVSMAGAGLVERMGRRPLILTSFTGMLAAFVLITGLSGGYATTKNASLGLGIIPFIFIFMGFYSVALTPLPYLYIPEISPLSLRAKSIALFQSTTSVILAFNNFVNPIALAAIGWKYYFVYIALLVYFGCVFFFFMKETKRLSIEEAALVYDDNEAQAALAHQRHSEGPGEVHTKEEDEKIDIAEIERRA